MSEDPGRPAPGAGEVVACRVNGTEVQLAAAPGELLIHALRGTLGLHGVRAGCGVGECGACTVLLDDAPIRACTTPLRSAAGAAVRTPEGLGGPDDPDPVQQAFLDLQAAQCGYCVNGVVMAVAGLRSGGEPTTPDRLLAALEEHLCRCGTQPRLLQAAGRALGIVADPAPSAAVGDATSWYRVVGDDADHAAGAVTHPPAALEAAPLVEQWLRLTDDGRVELLTGKAEIGQGVHVALAQVVAAELGVDVAAVLVVPAATGLSPDEGYTAGSRSMGESAPAVALAAATFRRLVLERAAAQLGVPATAMTLTNGVCRSAEGAACDLASVARGGPIRGRIDLSVAPSWSGSPLGESVGRVDLDAKLTGSGAYVHDLDLPGMLHARAVLPPTYDASLEQIDLAAARALPSVVRVERDGRFVVVVAESEAAATRAATALERTARWGDVGLGMDGGVREALRRPSTVDHVARSDAGVEQRLRAGRRRSASYSRPYQAHGAMAPSCAVALAHDDGRLQVWSHTQGVYPLRAELAALFDLPREEVLVVNAAGPGCYGQNAADDAAALAAVAARAVPGRPVRLQLTSAQEFGWEPHGSAMTGELTAALDPAGRVTAWRAWVRSDAQVARPQGQGDRLAVAWLRRDARPRPWTAPTDHAARNLVPIYAVGAVDAVAGHVRTPVRTGSLRSLGSFLNVFATESFVDELAEEAGEDPVAFRLAHLEDPRARRVLETVAEEAGWEPRVGPSGRGRGVSLLRYHDAMAYLALVVDVTVDVDRDLVRVDRMVMAADAGAVVNPSGLVHQLEGGALQGLSRTLHEELRVDGRGIHSRDWTTYPVLRFGGIPRIATMLLDRPGSPPLGAGEVATPAVPAAVANAIDDACGVRLRDLPISGAALRERLLHLDAEEAARVRVR